MNGFIFVYVTNPNREEAEKIAKHLVEKRLIACASLYENITSVYRWEGKVVSEREVILIAKTRAEKFDEVKREIEEMHSYSVPCIVKIPVEGNEKYFNWLGEETKD